LTGVLNREFTREIHAAPGSAALAEQARSTVTGGIDNTDAYYGPLNNPSQLARVAGFFDRVPGHASVVTGGHAIDGPGYLFEPTIVSGLRQDDEMLQDEMPHGGFKHSGYGKDLSMYGFEDYTRIKHVMSYIGA
jgi:acyl-CoA reductase-like NAD-dependent aldehyde dehydrogenase